MRESVMHLAVYFPNAKKPRWLVRKDRVWEFWRILPVNGVRGVMKKLFARLVFPRLLLVSPHVPDGVGSSDFLYLGVDDGKRTQLAVTLDGNSVVIEKSAVDGNAVSFLEKEAQILKTLRTEGSSEFPQFLSFENGTLKYKGAIPKAGFNPKRRDHREKLVNALARLYKNFPITRDNDGGIVCLSHRDLNMWNMFIAANGELHIFDFETMGEAPLGVDLATTYVRGLAHREYLRTLREDLLSLGTQVGCSDMEIETQIQKILWAM